MDLCPEGLKKKSFPKRKKHKYNWKNCTEKTTTTNCTRSHRPCDEKISQCIEHYRHKRKTLDKKYKVETNLNIYIKELVNVMWQRGGLDWYGKKKC